MEESASKGSVEEKRTKPYSCLLASVGTFVMTMALIGHMLNAFSDSYETQS
jgi:hypothetical protein